MKLLTTRLLCLLVAILLCSGAAFAIPGEISAKSAILMEASTGKILYQKDINTRRDIASTTKIMTALVTIERAKLSDVVTIKQSCTGIEGTSIYLKPGEKLTVEDLLYGLMLQSGNDAAVALADYVGGGDAKRFVGMMNDKAAALGLENTHFENPNGLTAEGHYSSARDMACLAAYALKNPIFQKIVSSQNYSGAGRYLKNHNRLLKMVDGADGVKTGFTKAAGRCLVSSAVRDGMRLVAVTLSDPNDWDDHIELYDYGFSSYTRQVFIQAGKAVATVPVTGGVSSQVQAAAVGELASVMTRQEADDAKLEIYLPRFLYAPIQTGEIIGEARLSVGGKVVAKTALVSTSDSLSNKKPGLWDKIRHFFNIG